MHRNIVIKTGKEAKVSVEELYELEQIAFQQWTDAGLYTPVAYTPIGQFQRYLTDKAGKLNWIGRMAKDVRRLMSEKRSLS